MYLGYFNYYWGLCYYEYIGFSIKELFEYKGIKFKINFLYEGRFVIID